MSTSTQAGAPARAAARPGRRPQPGLALLVIAVAQLMVVLDATIVNVALPHMQRALGFSGSGLEWVITAYAVTFGGLMLLGGRSGDLLGRRRVFIAGLLVFSAASLAGGFATSQAWLLAARAVQGVGGAMIAPTALALITTTFAEGPARDKAMGVYAAMAGGGGAVGLLAGGLLTSYVSWRWVLFVNVPIGVAAALAAPLVLPESQRRRGRFDLPGAITGTAGIAALVYGLSHAGTDASGVSHWGDAGVIAALAAAAVMLAAFAVIEARSRHALVPPRLLADRSRAGAVAMMLCLATAMFGIFFFLTLFVQDVLGFSPVRSGLAFLPFALMIVAASGIVSAVIGRTGARPLLLAGGVLTAGGMYWFSRITAHTGYASGLLGPILVTAAGLGLLFVPLSLVAMHRVADDESGAASSLLNTAQQVGGAIGLAAIGSVAWTGVAGSLKHQLAAAAAGGYRLGQPVPAAILHQALAAGFSRGLLAAAGVAVLALAVAAALIRPPAGRAGTLPGPAPEPAALAGADALAGTGTPPVVARDAEGS